MIRNKFLSSSLHFQETLWQPWTHMDLLWDHTHPSWGTRTRALGRSSTEELTMVRRKSPSGCPTWQIKERERLRGVWAPYKTHAAKFPSWFPPTVLCGDWIPLQTDLGNLPCSPVRLSCSLLWLRQQFSPGLTEEPASPARQFWGCDDLHKVSVRCVFIYSTRLCHSKLQSHQCLCFIHKTNSQCHYLTKSESPDSFLSTFSLLHVSPYNLRETGLLRDPQAWYPLLSALAMYPPKTCPLFFNQILSFLQNTPPLLTFLIHRDQWASIVLITDSSFTISHTVFGFTLWAYRQSSFTCILLAKRWAHSIKKRERKSNNKTTDAQLRMWPVLCILPTFLSTVPWGEHSNDPCSVRAQLRCHLEDTSSPPSCNHIPCVMLTAADGTNRTDRLISLLFSFLH